MVTEPNSGWIKVIGGSEPICTTTLNSPKTFESKKVQEKPNPAVLMVSNSSKVSSGVKRLTDAEIAKKRELGMCYWCDEKYSPTYRCKNRQLQMMVLQPCEEDDEDIQEEVGEREKVLELSISFVVGITRNHTMKHKGKVKEEQVLVLIESGTTHNFIVAELVEKLNLPVQIIETFQVSLEDGYKVWGKTICPDVRVEM